MEPHQHSEAQAVQVSRRMLFALFALAWLGVFATAGVASGLAQRAGAAAALANAVSFGLAAILMYPYFAIRSEMTNKQGHRLPPFWKYALHWAAASLVAHLLITPAVMSLFP